MILYSSVDQYGRIRMALHPMCEAINKHWSDYQKRPFNFRVIYNSERHCYDTWASSCLGADTSHLLIEPNYKNCRYAGEEFYSVDNAIRWLLKGEV